MFSKINTLKELGYTPDTILDIGAHHGLWTKNCLSIYNQSNYILFEAIKYPELTNNVSDKITVYNIILNNETKEVDWYEMRNTGDSMFKELNKPFENINPIKKMAYTLNSVLKHNNTINTSKNILIKIDCQGAEIPILQGSSNILDNTDFIILELPMFGQYNKGVPTFLEHIQYMDSIGFIPYDFLEDHIINNFCMQIDMMFINKNHKFNYIVQEKLTS